jgi:phosphoserine phosphatase RsbU/P
MMSVDIREPLRFLQHENIRLKEENQDLRQEVIVLRDVLNALRALQEVSATVNAQTDALSLLDRILQTALISIRASDGSLLLVDEEANELVFVVVHGKVRESLVGYRLPLGTGIAGWVAQHAEPAIIPNVQLDPRFAPTVDQNFRFYTRSMLCVPIVQGERVMGVIQALNKNNGDEFNEADLALFGVVAQLAAAAMRKAEAIFQREGQN